MNGDPKPEPEVLTGDVARSFRASAPEWTRQMTLRREPDGRVILVGESDGCTVWVQPKAWPLMTGSAPSPAINYGVQLAGVAQHAGRLETNDSGLGRELLGATAGREVPLPAVDPAASPYGTPAIIVAVGLVLAVLLARFRRK